MYGHVMYAFTGKEKRLMRLVITTFRSETYIKACCFTALVSFKTILHLTDIFLQIFFLFLTVFMGYWIDLCREIID